MLLGVHYCFHGLECGCEKELEAPPIWCEVELSCSVHRLRAVKSSSLRSLVHRVRWRIYRAPRRHAVPASLWRRCVTRLHSNRSRTPYRSVCPNGGASLPPPLLRTFHEMCARGADASPGQPGCSLSSDPLRHPVAVLRKLLPFGHSTSPPRLLRLGFHVARGICADRELRRRSHAHQGERSARPRTGCLCRSHSPLLCTTLCPSLEEGVCDETFLLIYTRAENRTHTHLKTKSESHVSLV